MHRVEHNAEQDCPDCDGSGKASCMSCRGSGLLPIALTECPWCNRGLLTCDTCDGAGKVEADDSLTADNLQAFEMENV